jgi:type I restriction enzyme, R subunit
MTRTAKTPEERESQLPAIELLQDLGWTFVDSDELDAERGSIKEVVLERRLRAAITKLNPGIPDDAVNQMVHAVMNPHSHGIPTTGLLAANEKVHKLVTLGYAYKVPDGSDTPTYRYIDFTNTGANEYVCTMEYRVEDSLKPESENLLDRGRFDVTCFVNGIPVVVMECKNPHRKDAVGKAVGDLITYQKRQGKAFETAEPLIAAAGFSGAEFGVVGTPARHYAVWLDVFRIDDPTYTIDSLQQLLGRRPTDQDLLVAGMLHPPNFLDIIRYFVVFEPEGDRTTKKMARYYQFRSVHRALQRLTGHYGDNAKNGGVIHHTQGAGKSLGMVFLAVKIRTEKRLGRPTILVLTDRKDLDRQIYGTFDRCGEIPPKQAKTSKDLLELLPKTGITVMSTIQKFLELDPGKDKYKAFRRPGKDVIVLVDEGHRTQYSKLRRIVKTILPDASFIAYTGTPIDRADRSTTEEFGGRIDVYSREQSIKDGNTLRILYDRRAAEERLSGADLDRLFERYFADYSEEEKEKIKSEGVTEAVIASAPRRVETIAIDILEHFEKDVKVNGFKAMVVTVSREAALQYRLAFEKMGYANCALIMTKNKEDKGFLRDHADKIPDDKDHASLVERFKDKNDPMDLLIVCDMLLTGFDAPVMQAMYFDSNLKDHNLLQALDRVNRPAEEKDYGYFIDYWGITEELAAALGAFETHDIEEVKRTVTSKKDRLEHLRNTQRAVKRHFGTNYGDRDACVALLGEDDARADFEYDFRNFARAFDTLQSEPEAGVYEDDVKFLGLVRQEARRVYDDPRLDVSECRERVKNLIHEHLISNNVVQIADRIEVTAERIRQEAEAQGATEAVAVKMAHAARRQLTVRLHRDPKFYRGLLERLDEVLKKRRERDESAAASIEAIAAIMQEAEEVADRAKELGLDDDEMAVYNTIHSVLNGTTVEHARNLAAIMRNHAQARDWKNPNSAAQQEMRRDLMAALYKAGIKDREQRVPLLEDLVSLAKARY